MSSRFVVQPATPVVSMDATRHTERAGDAALTETGGQDDGGRVLQVECGLNKAVLHLDRLCQGSKGACILFEKTWMTPNEFQAASGRETAKDWKRSIKHHDKSLKLLIIKGFLFTDPAVCKCEHCFSDSTSPSPPSRSNTEKIASEEQKEEIRGVDRGTKPKSAVTKRAPTSRRKRSSTGQAAPSVRQLRQTKDAYLSPKQTTDIEPAKRQRCSGRHGEREQVDAVRSEADDSGSVDSEKERDKENVINPDIWSEKSGESLPLTDMKQSIVANGEFPNESINTVETVDVAMNNGDCEGASRNVKYVLATPQDTNGESPPVANGFVETTAISMTEGKADSPFVAYGICPIQSDNMDINGFPNTEMDDLISENDLKNAEQKRSVLSELQFGCEPNTTGSAENQEHTTPTQSNVASHVAGCTDVGVAEATQQELAESKSSADRSSGSPSDVCLATGSRPGRSDTVGAGGEVDCVVALEDVEKSDTGLERATNNYCSVSDTVDVTNGVSDGRATSDSRPGLTVEIPHSERGDKHEVSYDVKDDDGFCERMPKDECRERLSPQREARLLNIIEELKVYKKQLVEKIEGNKRCPAPTSDIKNKEDASPMSEFAKTHQSPRSPCLRDSKSAPSLESSISPLQQILSYSSLRQTSSVDDIMRATTAGGKCGRSSTSRRLTYHAANDFGRSPWTASGVEQTASTTLHYAAGYDGTGVGNPLPFTRHSTEPCSRKRNIKDNCFAGMDPKMYNDTIIYNSIYNVFDNAGGIKTPKRRGIGPVITSFGAGFANKSPLLPVLPPSSPKRLQQRTWSEATVPKQRRCWPVSNNNNNNNTNNNICVLNLSNHKTNGSVPAVTTGVSQPEARRASKTSKERRGTTAEPMVVAATHGSKAARRSPISSWSADDVHAFVLSTPHGSLYAKEFLEHRISGRVLQNLTAIQMMRILRIGEHAARAVRAAVEKILMTSPGLTHAPGTRR